jgi:prepilin-type N-terminal cleavage/methylation domain-containing protein
MTSRRISAGFTLVEILLVVVILAVAAGIAVPSFSRSFRGAKLRNSVRMVLMAHRSAQSKAVLGQRYVAILFDAVKQTVEVVDQGQLGAKKDAFFGTLGSGAPAGGTMGAVAGGGDPEPSADAGGGTSSGPSSVLVRQLEEGVRILEFRGGNEIDELHFVAYYPNGSCQPYEVRLGDDGERATRIEVDGVTGRAKVVRE